MLKAHLLRSPRHNLYKSDHQFHVHRIFNYVHYVGPFDRRSPSLHGVTFKGIRITRHFICTKRPPRVRFNGQAVLLVLRRALFRRRRRNRRPDRRLGAEDTIPNRFTRQRQLISLRFRYHSRPITRRRQLNPRVSRQRIRLISQCFKNKHINSSLNNRLNRFRQNRHPCRLERRNNGNLIRNHQIQRSTKINNSAHPRIAYNLLMNTMLRRSNRRRVTFTRYFGTLLIILTIFTTKRGHRTFNLSRGENSVRGNTNLVRIFHRVRPARMYRRFLNSQKRKGFNRLRFIINSRTRRNVRQAKVSFRFSLRTKNNKFLHTSFNFHKIPLDLTAQTDFPREKRPEGKDLVRHLSGRSLHRSTTDGRLAYRLAMFL